MIPGYNIKKAAACSVPPGDKVGESGRFTSSNRDQHEVSGDSL